MWYIVALIRIKNGSREFSGYSIRDGRRVVQICFMACWRCPHKYWNNRNELRARMFREHSRDRAQYVQIHKKTAKAARISNRRHTTHRAREKFVLQKLWQIGMGEVCKCWTQIATTPYTWEHNKNRDGAERGQRGGSNTLTHIIIIIFLPGRRRTPTVCVVSSCDVAAKSRDQCLCYTLYTWEALWGFSELW